MTIVTAHALTAGVVVVTKDRFENISRLRRTAIRGKRVTDVTGTDLARRRVAAIAIVMSSDAGWNRFAGAGRTVT